MRARLIGRSRIHSTIPLRRRQTSHRRRLRCPTDRVSSPRCRSASRSRSADLLQRGGIDPSRSRSAMCVRICSRLVHRRRDCCRRRCVRSLAVGPIAEYPCSVTTCSKAPSRTARASYRTSNSSKIPSRYDAAAARPQRVGCGPFARLLHAFLRREGAATMGRGGYAPARQSLEDRRRCCDALHRAGESRGGSRRRSTLPLHDAFIWTTFSCYDHTADPTPIVASTRESAAGPSRQRVPSMRSDRLKLAVVRIMLLIMFLSRISMADRRSILRTSSIFVSHRHLLDSITAARRGSRRRRC